MLSITAVRAGKGAGPPAATGQPSTETQWLRKDRNGRRWGGLFCGVGNRSQNQTPNCIATHFPSPKNGPELGA